MHIFIYNSHNPNAKQFVKFRIIPFCYKLCPKFFFIHQLFYETFLEDDLLEGKKQISLLIC